MPNELIPKLRFPEFKDNWKEKKLKRIISNIQSGVSVNSVNESVLENESGILKTSCVSGGEFLFYENKKILEEEIDRAKLNPREGNIIFSRMNTPNLVGESGYVYGNYPNLFLPDRLWLLTIDESESNPLFASVLLSSTKMMDIFSSIATGTSASMKNISQPSFLNVIASFPSLPEQTKIAKFLSAVDEKIKTLTKKKTLLEEYKKGVMKRLFSQEIRFKDEQGQGFPDWEEKKLEEVIRLKLREVNKPETEFLSIGIRSHGKGTFQKNDFDPSKIQMDKLYQVEENDLIVNITFAWEGAIAIVKKEDSGGLVSHRFPTYIFNRKKLIPDYFRYVIIDKKFAGILELISPGGAGRNRVMSKKDFLKISWNFPTVYEQQKIANFLTALDEKITKASQQIETAQAFKKGLLQKMFV